VGPESELRTIERRRLAALCSADMPVCDELHADDYQLVTPGGATMTKAEYLGQIGDRSLDYRTFEPDGDISVRMFGPDAGALRYRVSIDVAFPGGEESARFWHTDIYERRSGRWQVVWSQATRIRS
jgi:hypothetical protein